MNTVLLPTLFCGLVVALSLFWLGFIVARRLDNFGIADIVWAILFPALVLLYAFHLPGDPFRTSVFLILVLFWGGRLGIHLARRIRHEHPREDGRYHQLRHNWGPRFPLIMFGFFTAQAVSAWALAIPFTLILANPDPGLGSWEIAGTLLWGIALAGEAAADAQLRRFKNQNDNQGLTCRSGLWNYSRHPNYFFQWLSWIALFVFACGTPWGWIAFYAPLIMLYLLLRVTGIPPTEAQALRSKGDAYRRYQQTTNAFFPGPRRLSSGG